MNNEMNVQDTEQQTAADQTEQTGAENENRAETKTFTQEEVDKIVEKRLSRERKKFASVLEGTDPREAELAERERAVAVKELQADMKPLFMEKEIPMEALELLNYTDKESCDKSFEVLMQVIQLAGQNRVNRLLRGGEPPKRAPEERSDDALRRVFGL